MTWDKAHLVPVVRPHILPEHDVVIQVDELMGQVGNAVDVAFNGWGAERWEVRLVWKYCRVRHHAHMRIA